MMQEKKCPSCGGTDHQRNTSALCKAVVSNAANNASKKKSNEQKKAQFNKPSFINVGSKSKKFKPVIDVSDENFCPRETSFKLIFDGEYGLKETKEPTAENLMHKYFPFYLIDEWVKASNLYIAERKVSEPHLWMWTKKWSSDITHGNLYHFLAIIYYMGICKLPSKTDYWSTHKFMPKHEITTMFGMTRDRFKFIWRHFHVQAETEHYQEDDGTEDEDDDMEELFVDQVFERVQKEEEYLLQDDSSVDSSDSNHDEYGERSSEDSDKEEEEDEEGKKRQHEEKKEHPRKQHVWYYKIEAFVNHVRDINFDVIFVLGTCLSLDEMMIRFMGRSSETHRMKNKPIKEGFKFFTLCTSQGFCVHFTPHGRTAANQGRQEYAVKKSDGKIAVMVEFITSIIDRFREKQFQRNLKKATRYEAEVRKDDVEMEKFCLAMDNYFTLPDVIISLRKKTLVLLELQG